MPVPQTRGGWSTRCFVSDESQQWDRRLLTWVDRAENAVPPPIGADSVEAALLSECAEYGTPVEAQGPREGRAELGEF